MATYGHSHGHTIPRSYYYFDEQRDEFVLWGQPRTEIPQLESQQGGHDQTHTLYQDTYPDAALYDEEPAFQHSHARSQIRQHEIPGSRLGTINTPTDDMTAERYWSQNYNCEILDIRNSRSRVRSLFGIQPREAVTDPELVKLGIYARRMLIGTEEMAEEKYPDYRVQDPSAFRCGQVFAILWSDFVGEGSSLIESTQPSQPAHRARRFVVVKESEHYCSAIPIATYGLKGVSKHGVVKSHHAIIHTGRSPPAPLRDEYPRRGESGMRAVPIRVDAYSPYEKLDECSRVDFAKVHTIMHNVKVKNFGEVHPSSRQTMIAQFRNVWADIQRDSQRAY